MIHKAKRCTIKMPKGSSVDFSKSEKFHPLSYFLNGGIDLTGRALDRSAEVEYDTDTDIQELESEGFMSVPYGDPRESKFSLVEKYGTYADNVSSKSPIYADNSDVTESTVVE